MFCQLTLAVEAENREAFRVLEELSALSVIRRCSRAPAPATSDA
jgi:hypothetical protein